MRLGRRVGAQDVAFALGLSVAQVERLSAGRGATLRGAHLLALETVGRLGLDAALELDDPAPAFLAWLVDGIALPYPERERLAARLLSVSREHLASLCGRGARPHAAPPRLYLLALLEVARAAGPESELARTVERAAAADHPLGLPA